MTETTLDLKRITVGELKKFLAEVPDDVAVDVSDSGTGFVESIEISKCKWSNGEFDIDIDVECLSGFD